MGLLKPIKIKPLLKPASVENSICELPLEQVKTSSSAKNDTPNKFWASVEPYCAPFTDEDLKFVEELIAANQDAEEYFKIPALGRHYTFGCDDTQRLLDTVSKQNGDPNATSQPICGPIT